MSAQQLTFIPTPEAAAPEAGTFAAADAAERNPARGRWRAEQREASSKRKKAWWAAKRATAAEGVTREPFRDAVKAPHSDATEQSAREPKARASKTVTSLTVPGGTMSAQLNSSNNEPSFFNAAAAHLGDVENLINPVEAVADDSTAAPAKKAKSDLAPVSAEERSETEALIAGYAASPDLTAAVNPAAIAPPIAKVQSKVPLVKAGTGDKFRRVLKRAGYNLQGARCIEYKDGVRTSLYLVAPGAVLPDQVSKNVKTFNLYTVVDHTGEYAIWYINMYPGTWRDSAIDMLREAVQRWVKVVSAGDRYDYILPEASIPEPVWDVPPFADLLSLAFKGNIVKDANHLVVRKLLGYTTEGTDSVSAGLGEDGF